MNTTPGADSAVGAGDADSAANRYKKQHADREPYVRRARDCASVTIPALMPPDGSDGSTDLPQPWQSVGPRGVNNLQSKLLLSLFPSEIPFFKISPTAAIKEQFAQQGTPDSDVEAALSKAEAITLEDIESSGDRSPMAELLKLLIVTGNALLHMPPDGARLRVFRLDRYTVRRDLSGNVLEIIVEEKINYDALDADLRAAVDTEQEIADYKSGKKDITIYTRVWRDGSRMRQVQEICGKRIDGTEGNWPIEYCPWLPLRMVSMAGEHYGRSYVEEYLGDLLALDSLSQSIVEGSKAAAEFKVLVKPNGQTSKKAFASAKNGDVISGNVEDVGVHQSQKQMDLQVAGNTASAIEQRLSFAFLMNTAIQRQAERVTAEEIRYMAEELDSTLGGVYTLLSLELQLPYVQLKIRRLQKTRQLPTWPKKTLRVSISTGLEAIGRGRDVQRLRESVAILAEMFGPEAVAKIVNPMEAAKRVFAGKGVLTDNLVNSQQDIEAAAQQEQAAATQQSVAPEMVKQAGQLINNAASSQTAAP